MSYLLFSSFQGDCVWDSMACLRSNSRDCCQARFDNCCADIMGAGDSLSEGQTTTTEAPTTTTEKPYEHASTLSEYIPFDFSLIRMYVYTVWPEDVGAGVKPNR